MENWKKGDTAICVNNGHLESNSSTAEIPALRLNAQYIVNAVRVCECGTVTLDVGLTPPKEDMGIRCQCGALSSPKSGIHWAHSIRFVKPKTDEAEAEEENIEEQIKIALEAGDISRVDELLDKINK